MIILALLIGGVALWAGYLWGFERGKTVLERKILNYVIHSPNYNDQIVKAIKSAVRVI